MDDVHVAFREVVAGDATGPALVLAEPLSLWGGLDPLTGTIIDRRHPQFGECVAGTVLFMGHGRGSSSASSVLAEAIRLGTAPVAIVLDEADEILVLGSLVAYELYGIVTPVLLKSPMVHCPVETGQSVTIRDGTVRISGKPVRKSHDRIARR